MHQELTLGKYDETMFHLYTSSMMRSNQTSLFKLSVTQSKYAHPIYRFPYLGHKRAISKTNCQCPFKPTLNAEC